MGRAKNKMLGIAACVALALSLVGTGTAAHAEEPRLEAAVAKNVALHPLRLAPEPALTIALAGAATRLGRVDAQVLPADRDRHTAAATLLVIQRPRLVQRVHGAVHG